MDTTDIKLDEATGDEAGNGVKDNGDNNDEGKEEAVAKPGRQSEFDENSDDSLEAAPVAVSPLSSSHDRFIFIC